MRNTEGSKSDEANFAATGEGVSNRIKNTVNDLARIRLAQTGGARHACYELVFVHYNLDKVMWA